MDFYSAYRHGFARIAACTHHTTLADPAANAESVLRMARECHNDGVALAVFPELTMSGYSIEDIRETILRAKLSHTKKGNPRIHFAASMATNACPVMRIYTAENLDQATTL